MDISTFTMLYEKIYKELYRFALYTMKHPQDAEDVVSEAVVAAYENMGKLRSDEAFKGWIFKILTNKCKKKLMNNKHDHEELDEEMLVYEQSGLNLDIWNAFQGLADEERFIVALSVFGGYNSKEIGKMARKNPSSVRSTLSRALKKMEQELNKED